MCWWLREQQYPGQRLGWYLQGVKFYLNHLGKSGRSLDSPKRRAAQAAFQEHCDGIDEGMMSEIQARDIVSVLEDRLDPIDRIILGDLADGLAIRDIAEKLHRSHMFVVRHHHQIATLARRILV